MTSIFSRKLLASIATFCGFGLGAVLANEPLKANSDLACRANVFAGNIPTFQSGDVLPMDGIFAISLLPAADVAYFVRSGYGAPHGYGGVATIESVAAGRYRIVLSQEAQLTAVHQRPSLPIAVQQWNDESVCPGTTEIAFEGGPLTLQLHGTATSSISVAVIRLPD